MGKGLFCRFRKPRHDHWISFLSLLLTVYPNGMKTNSRILFPFLDFLTIEQAWCQH
jgi:hypothetical protein